MELGRDFQIKSNTTGEKWTRQHIEHLSQTLDLLIPSWEEADDSFKCFMSVDGTHCPICEPRPFSERWSGFKLGGSAGVNCEFGLQINQDKLLWVQGPVPAGETGNCGACKRALQPKPQALGHDKTIVADSICTPDCERVSAQNNHDSREVARFKERVCAHHEFFNHCAKLFQVFTKKFRHEKEGRHKMMVFHGKCMRAVLAIQCTQMETGGILPCEPCPQIQMGVMNQGLGAFFAESACRTKGQELHELMDK